MEMIQEIDLFGNAKTGFLPSILIAMLGILLYTFMNIYQSRRVKKFSDIKIRTWWDENQVNFVFTVFICLCVIIASWYAGTLTIERCFFVGFIGNHVGNLILKMKYK